MFTKLLLLAWSRPFCIMYVPHNSLRLKCGQVLVIRTHISSQRPSYDIIANHSWHLQLIIVNNQIIIQNWLSMITQFDDIPQHHLKNEHWWLWVISGSNFNNGGKLPYHINEITSKETFGCKYRSFFQMSTVPNTSTRPGHERDADRILEMVRGEGWTVPTELMLMDALHHGVVRVTTDADDHVLSKYKYHDQGQHCISV